MALQESALTLPSPVPPPGVECRLYERNPCAMPTSCQPASVSEMNDLRWSATIVDLSQGGLRLILKRRFEKGTGLAIELPGTETRKPSVVFVRVVHVKNQGNGDWALGCKLISELSEEEMQSLLSATQYVLPTREEPAP